MAVFSYIAKDSNQKGIKGSIVSDSPSAARRSLRDAGLTVISMSSIGENLPNRTALTEKPKDNSVDARGDFDVRRSPSIWNWGLDPTPFLGDLATLLSVGVPLVEALETLIRQAKGRWQGRLLALKESVESGLTLRDAMERQSDIFDELSISLVEMGENTGRLDDSLRRLADFKRRSSEFRDRVFNALMYPGVILVMSVGVSLFLMNFVVPTLLENLADMGQELPWPTKVLKFISDVIVSYGHYMLMFAIAAMFGVVLFLATKAGKRIRDQVVLKLPLVGNMSRKHRHPTECQHEPISSFNIQSQAFGKTILVSPIA